MSPSTGAIPKPKKKKMKKRINLHIIKSITFGNEAEIYTTETFEELKKRLWRDHNNEIVKA